MSGRTALVACEIFFRELCRLMAESETVYDAVFLPKGLHDLGGAKMREVLQAEIDRLSEKEYTRIVLGYCLCNNGTAGLVSRRAPLVIPRAHDCISLFLGSKQRYDDYFRSHPGTYFHTVGWIERGRQGAEYFDDQMGPSGTGLEEFVSRYGEDNGRFLWETIGRPAMLRNYRRIAYISLPGFPDLREESKRVAQERGFDWEEVEGDICFLRALVNGPHDPAGFLTVAPGQTVAASYDCRVICAAPLG